MNAYLAGAIDTCKALASNKGQFISYVKIATGFTVKGIQRNSYIQAILNSWEDPNETSNEASTTERMYQVVGVSGEAS